MADRLYNILNFSGIAIGSTQTLAHGLVCNGEALKPDRVDLQFQDAFEFVSADTTNLTVRNTSSSSGACQAWCQVIHPIERSFGSQPNDGSFTGHLTPQPFVSGSPNGGGGGGSGPFEVVVFRPGGTAGQNVFTDWSDVMTALSSLQGQRVLQFDDSDTSPIVIPTPTTPGTPYPMDGVIWASSPDRIAQVHIPEGVSFTKLRTFTNRVQVTFTGATSPLSDFGLTAPQVDLVTINGGAAVASTGTAAMFAVGAVAQFNIGTQSSLLAGTHPVLNVTAAVTVSVFVQGPGATVADNSIQGIVGSTLTLTTQDAGIALASSTQPGYSGTLTPVNATRDYMFPTAVLTSGVLLIANATTQLTLVNPTGGAFAVTLPAAAGLEGQSIALKNTTSSTNNVTLTAGAGDNIDGAATLVLSAAHFFTKVTSDGVHTWYVTT